MAGTTTTNEFNKVTPREVDFVTRFNTNSDALRAILGITTSSRSQLEHSSYHTRLL